MNIKNNLQFQATHQKIQDVLLELLKTKEIRKITVKDICTSAQINRSTFYAHYIDVPDLMEQTGREMMSDVADLMEQSENVIDFFISQEHLTQLITYIREHQTFFDAYLNHCPPSATEPGFSSLWETVRPYLQHLGLTDEAEMMYHFTIYKAGFLAVLSKWLQRECPEEPEKLAKIIIRSQPQFDQTLL